MTGIESVAVGAAAKASAELIKTGSEAAKADREVRKAERLALLEEVKNSQGFKDAAAVRGKRMAVREQMGLALFAPLAKMFRIRQDYFEADFARDFAASTADVPEENLQPPKPSIAAPAMEGLGYSLDEPELKDLYLELLARAADDRSAEAVHPSFTEVIRQLTSKEAALLKTFDLSRGKLYPIVRMKTKKPGELGSKTVLSNIIPHDDPETGSPIYDDAVPMYLDNWQRLGLIELAYGTELVDPGRYDWVDTRPEKLAVTMTAAGAGAELEVEKGVFRITDFGHEFGRVLGLQQD